MNEHDIHIERLAEELAILVEFVPKTKDELELWYDRAQVVLEDSDLLKGAPHFLWHYLADADIRMKDDVYAEMQGRRINLLLQHLKRGVMPSDEDTYV
ncbi:MAG TPA: hypothetical protein VGQ55_10960 [Pyrinomonadaceae bacterium]|jgi:hypothetical protein|nr:hypothetical protein [Pyrinomonadaceae bacterium]